MYGTIQKHVHAPLLGLGQPITMNLLEVILKTNKDNFKINKLCLLNIDLLAILNLIKIITKYIK